jgi:hypothetical protein
LSLSKPPYSGLDKLDHRLVYHGQRFFIMFRDILHKINVFFHGVSQVHRLKATDMLTFELNEMENVFAMLVFGSFVGLPAPPAAIAIELLPCMEDEIRLMVSRSDFAQDAMCSVMDMLHVD